MATTTLPLLPRPPQNQPPHHQNLPTDTTGMQVVHQNPCRAAQPVVSDQPQNGRSHFEAGDSRAKEYVGLLKSNDPVGFNVVDVLAWGSIGHIVAYYILATSSNGYDPNFFG